VRHKSATDVLGNARLEHFDVCIVGSGAGGGTAAHVLTAAGKNVLVLEAGPLTYEHLDDPKRDPVSLHSNDELKYDVRHWITPLGELEPRTFRTKASAAAKINADVNQLPRLVGGAFGHADVKVPRFAKVDFRLKSAMAEVLAANPTLAVPGFGADAASANFADWPFGYDDLEPFYVEIERLYGAQGDDSNPYASARSQPHPMPPGVPMYFALKLAAGAQATSLFGRPLTPHAYPGMQASRPYDGRPPCVDCGLCSGFGCSINAKGVPAVVTVRKALLSGRCQLRYNAHVVKLAFSGSAVTGVTYVDGTGAEQTATADAFMLAASPIESARLCLLSNVPSSSGQIGRNLMFHLQTNVNGFAPERIHGQRGRAVTHGISDLRGVEPGGEALRVFATDTGPQVWLGGVCEFGASQGRPISEDGINYSFSLGLRFGAKLKNAMRDLPLGQHLFGMIMQAEDAPQLGNMVDLDPTVKDVFGRPVARVTYANHAFELGARDFYVGTMKSVVQNAGANPVFTTPCDLDLGGAPTSRHVMGTLRMGSDPATSVVDANGKFHEVDNLYACDGSIFVTSSGWNPTLTIMAVAARIAHTIAGTPPVVA
jgi:choline dehydrogenase-like flavoprotein